MLRIRGVVVGWAEKNLSKVHTLPGKHSNPTMIYSDHISGKDTRGFHVRDSADMAGNGFTQGWVNKLELCQDVITGASRF